MAIGLIIPDRDLGDLIQALAGLTDAPIQVWPEDPLDAVALAVVWNPPNHALTGCTRLRAAISFGAGVDALLGSTALADDLPLGRIVGSQLQTDLARYVLGAVLSLDRRFEQYRNDQRLHRWRPEQQHRRSTIGLLGYGAVGRRIAEAFVHLGFATVAWRRSNATDEQIPVRCGPQGLERLLGEADYVINTLPLTSSTFELINRSTLGQMQPHAWLINVGRGATLNTRHVLEALDANELAGAWLDVFAHEPLPDDDLLWAHPKVRITPHVAALTDAKEAAQQIATSYQRIQQGLGPLNPVNRERGY